MLIFEIVQRENLHLKKIFLTNRHKRPLQPPAVTENIYENVPPRRQRGDLGPNLGGRQAAPLPPVPPKKIPNGIHPPMASTSAAVSGNLINSANINGSQLTNGTVSGISLSEQRLRGVSVDRYREYQTPGYYEDTYYTRVEDNDRRVTVKHVDHPPLANGRLERHSSHPNLRPRPSTAGGRQLPKTPNQPPGTIIVIENVVSGRGRTLPDVRRAGSSAAIHRNPRLRAAASNNAAATASASIAGVAVGDSERRSLSLPRRPTNAKPPVKDIPQGTGRRLPKTPKQSAMPLQHHGPVASASGRKRELPKPQSLELRHSNREIMNTSNASMGLGGLMGRSSRSMNFPRLEGSPTHSECSSESGYLLSRPRFPGGSGGLNGNVLRSNSVSRRKLPDV